MMMPSLNTRCLSKLHKVAKHRSSAEIPRVATEVRNFVSARPLQGDRHKVEQLQLTSNASSAALRSAKEGSPTAPPEVYSSNDCVEEFESLPETIFTGNATMPVTSILCIVKPGEDAPRGTWPVFRLMDENGKFRDPPFDAASQTLTQLLRWNPTNTRNSRSMDLADLRAELQEQYPFHAKEFEASRLMRPSKHPYADTNSKDTLMRAHRQMVRLREMDTILQNAQRQGRISFYMTCRGEEAIHFGVASALDSADTVFAQYREAGLLMWRGFTLEQFADQCFSNKSDLGKGRQMPVHYGSRALHYQTISSPLGTQIPQATGAAYHHKLQGKSNVAVCFFGDGAASTTDFHSGLNFAATLKAPVLFFCRNNGYAISTPVADQYAGDGIISRAPGYGMAGVRVDGNDIFAVHAAVREAREYALESSAPVLIEAMTYRVGHHSTSDDSSRYRDKKEVEYFEDRSDPINRCEKFLIGHNWISETEVHDARIEEKRAALKAMGGAEKRAPPPLKDLFTDVYRELTPRLEEQEAKLHEHMKKHQNKY